MVFRDLTLENWFLEGPVHSLLKKKIDVYYGNQLKLFGTNMFWDETNLKFLNGSEEEDIGVKNWRFLHANMALINNLFMSTTETNLKIWELLSGTNLKFWSL